MSVCFGFALPELPEQGSGPARDARSSVVVDLATAAEVAGAFSGSRRPAAVHAAWLGEGCLFRVESGRRDDCLLAYGDQAVFHIGAGGRRVLCAPEDVASPGWRRFLLDTGLTTAALLQGFEALHAGAVERPSGILAVAAVEGGGKSTLIGELVAGGHALVCDDVLVLSRTDRGDVVGHPGPPLMNTTSAPPGARLLASIAGEQWVALDGGATNAQRVAAIAILERGAHETIVVERLPPNPAALLRHSLQSGSRAQRLVQRFELFGDIARRAALMRVQAPAAAAPGVVVDALLTALADEGV